MVTSTNFFTADLRIFLGRALIKKKTERKRLREGCVVHDYIFFSFSIFDGKCDANIRTRIGKRKRCRSLVRNMETLLKQLLRDPHQAENKVQLTYMGKCCPVFTFQS